MRRISIASVLVALLSCCVCRDAGSAGEEFQVPPPAAGASELPAVTDSVLRATVSVDLAPLRSSLRARLPSPLSRGSRSLHIPIRVDAIRNPIAKLVPGVHLPEEVAVAVVVDHQIDTVDAGFAIHGSQLTIDVIADVTLGVVAQTPIQPVGLLSCGHGEPRGRIELSVTGAVAIAPEGGLRFHRSGAVLRWLRPCNLTAVPVSLEDLAQLPAVRGLIDRQIEALLAGRELSYAFGPRLAELWQRMARPIALADRVWLAITPRAIDLAGVTGSGTRVAVDARLAFQARLVLGDRPAPASAPFTRLSPIAAPEGFHIHLLSSLSYRDAERLLAPHLQGEHRIGDRPVVIGGIRIYGTKDGRVVVGVDLSRPFRATLYLVGTPRFDPETGTIAVRDLRYSVETSSLLARLADRIWHEPLTARIAAAAVFPIDARCVEALAWLRQRRVAAGPLALTVDAAELAIDGLFPGTDAMHVVVSARGRVTAEVAP